MSKSIEERAKYFAIEKAGCGSCPLDYTCPRNNAEGIGCDKYNRFRRLYLIGATDQKAIDDEEYRKEREKQWIVVSEHTMPRCYRIDDEKRSKQLLFKTRDGRTHFGIYSYYPTGEWCCEDGSLDEDIPASSGEVTHWHPLPDDKAEFEE